MAKTARGLADNTQGQNFSEKEFALIKELVQARMEQKTKP